VHLKSRSPADAAINAVGKPPKGVGQEPRRRRVYPQNGSADLKYYQPSEEWNAWQERLRDASSRLSLDLGAAQVGFLRYSGPDYSPEADGDRLVRARKGALQLQRNLLALPQSRMSFELDRIGASPAALHLVLNALDGLPELLAQLEAHVRALPSWDSGALPEGMTARDWLYLRLEWVYSEFWDTGRVGEVSSPAGRDFLVSVWSDLTHDVSERGKRPLTGKTHYDRLCEARRRFPEFDATPRTRDR